MSTPLTTDRPVPPQRRSSRPTPSWTDHRDAEPGDPSRARDLRPGHGLGRHRGVHAGATLVDRLGLPWLLATLTVIVLVVALAATTLSSGRASTITGLERYPGTPPAEYAAGPAWASPPLAPGIPAVAVGAPPEESVALVTAERTLVLVSAADGQVRWRSPLPRGAEIHGRPAPTRIDGEDVVALHVGERLAWWSLDDGTPHEMEIPTGAVVSVLGEVPLVAHGRQVTPAGAGARAAVTVPDGMIALAAHEDGQVTVAGPTGWAHLGPDGSTRSSGPWENATSPSPTVAGYSGGVVLVVRPGPHGTATLEAHADRTTDVRYLFGGPVLLPPGGRLTWTASPAGTWGILGRALVDLRTGRVDDLGAWSTRTVTADRAYGHIDGSAVVVGPTLARGMIAPGEAIPEALTTAGALVRGPAPNADTSGGVDPRRNDDTVYLLPARRSAS